jgi:hypothetical protein
MLISSRQISANPQPQTKGINTMNVRQWTEHEIPLINEGDEEIPLTRLHIKADIFQRMKDEFVPKKGDRVRVKRDVDLGRYTPFYVHNTGTVLHPEDFYGSVKVEWDKPISDKGEGRTSSFRVQALERSI